MSAAPALPHLAQLDPAEVDALADALAALLASAWLATHTEPHESVAVAEGER